MTLGHVPRRFLVPSYLEFIYTCQDFLESEGLLRGRALYSIQRDAEQLLASTSCWYGIRTKVLPFFRSGADVSVGKEESAECSINLAIACRFGLKKAPYLHLFIVQCYYSSTRTEY